MINIDNISFSYGQKRILKDFSLKIQQGDRICLFGKSGCGKTTLLRLISGLEKPDGGKIEKPSELKTSVVFQEDRLLPFYSVIDNITLIGADKDTALKHLKALGVEHTSNLKPFSLSGGMQRRVAIARALSADYDILILDEPFTGLDPENIKQAATHIINTLGERPMIIVSHSLWEAELFGSEIINL